MSIRNFRMLTPVQRRIFFLVTILAIAMAANTLYLVFAGHVAGIGRDPEVLPSIYQWMLVVHVAFGILTFAVAVGFAATHVARVYRIRKLPSRYTGITVVATIAVLLLSGFFILSEANSRENAWIFLAHQLVALLIAASYIAHRFLSSDPPLRTNIIRSAVAIASGVIGVWLVHWLEAGGATVVAPIRAAQAVEAKVPTPDDGTGPPLLTQFRAVGDPDARLPLFPSKTTTTTGGYLPSRILTHDDLPNLTEFRAETQKKGFAPSYFLGAQSCEHCHADIVKQWASSVHRFASFNNPFYRKSVELTRQTAGLKRSQFCGGCHDPAIMLAGNMQKVIDPLTPESQAGLTCLACHAIDRIHDKTGNGNYNIHDNTESPYLFDMAKSA